VSGMPRLAARTVDGASISATYTFFFTTAGIGCRNQCSHVLETPADELRSDEVVNWARPKGARAAWTLRFAAPSEPLRAEENKDNQPQDQQVGRLKQFTHN
jgi:hypothetical protein